MRSPERLPPMRLGGVINLKNQFTFYRSENLKFHNTCSNIARPWFHISWHFFPNIFCNGLTYTSLTDEWKTGIRKLAIYTICLPILEHVSIWFNKAGNGSQKLHIPCAPEISAVNWRMSAMAQNNEDSLYKHGSINGSVRNSRHSKVFQAQVGYYQLRLQK
jgi:hypothetical protein